MTKAIKKILSGFVLSAVLLVVGGFCGVQMADASSQKTGGMTSIDSDNCGMHEKIAVEQGSDSKDGVMPCCVEKHDNSTVTTPSVLMERLKFYQTFTSQQQTSVAVNLVGQKIYSSSESPPEPDTLSSVIRLE